MPLKMEQLTSFGVIMIIIGFIAVFAGAFMSAKETASKSKVAVGGFIGPIPFGFGNDKNLVWFAAALSLVMLLVWLLFSYKFART